MELPLPLAPWKTLAEQFAILEPELQRRILALSHNQQLFTKDRAAIRHRAKDVVPTCMPAAMAALQADENLSRLRYRLVPARLSEEDFWRCYFFNVAMIKLELCNDFKTANETRRAFLTAARGAASPNYAASRAPGATEAPTTTDHDFPFDLAELDAEFESLVGGRGDDDLV